MNRILNIALNIETLSRKTNAAIIAITAVPFERRLEIDIVNGQEVMDLGPLMDQSEMFHRVINGTSCIMEGLDVEPDTVQWWKNHTDLDKSEILEKAVSLQSALKDFAVWINSLKDEKDRYKAETIEVWILGPTFDWPILMNAYRASGITFQYQHQCHVRDVRTYCENAVMIMKGVEKAYADHWRENLDGYSEDAKTSDMPKIIKLVEMVRSADRMLINAAIVSYRKSDSNLDSIMSFDREYNGDEYNGGLILSGNPVKIDPGIYADPAESDKSKLIKFSLLRAAGFGQFSIIRYYEKNDKDPKRFYTLLIDRFNDDGSIRFHAVFRHNSDGSIVPMNINEETGLVLRTEDCQNGEVFPVEGCEYREMLEKFKVYYTDIALQIAKILPTSDLLS